MKAVVLEVRGKEAAVLNTDGEIIKIRQKNLKAGDTIELSEEMLKGKKLSIQSAWRYGAVAAAAALFLGGGGIYSYNNVIACSYVSLDINPSIEFTLNRQNLVLDVDALNEDAGEIVTALKEEGVKKDTLSQAMEKVTELLEKYGYMDTESTDYVLVNVSCDSEQRRTLLKEEVSSVFAGINKTNEGTVNLTVTESSVSERKSAKSLGISSGEYQEIKKIKENETAASNPEVRADDIEKYGGLEVRELLEWGQSPEDSEKSEKSQKDNEQFTDNEGTDRKNETDQNVSGQKEDQQSGKDQSEEKQRGNSQSEESQPENVQGKSQQAGNSQSRSQQSENAQESSSQSENNQDSKPQSQNGQQSANNVAGQSIQNGSKADTADIPATGGGQSEKSAAAFGENSQEPAKENESVGNDRGF